MTMTPKQNKPVKGTAGQIAEARLQRLQHQNEKLQIEVRRLKAEWVPFESIKSDVLRANATVKQQLLALPYRLSESLAQVSEPREVARILREALVQCLNDLAHGREQEAQPDICPCCGQRKGEIAL